MPESLSKVSQVYSGDETRLQELLKEGCCRNLHQLVFRSDGTNVSNSRRQAVLCERNSHFLSGTEWE